VITAADLSVVHDARGRVTAMAGNTYTYDLFTGKTAQITLPTVTSPEYISAYETFSYGSAGERAVKKLVQTRYWNGNNIRSLLEGGYLNTVLIIK
jgi:hypothetical protein